MPLYTLLHDEMVRLNRRTHVSRKLSKAERKLQRKAMFARAHDTGAKSVTGEQSLDAILESIRRHEEPPAEAQPEAAPIQKRVQRLLETSAAELEQAEIEVLDELLAAAREGIALYKAEARARAEAQQRGQPITTRWQVAPGVFEKLTGRVLRIIEIKLRHRRDRTRDQGRDHQGTALAG
jgi:hypothetical protein